MDLRPMTDVEKRAAARHFIEVWTGKGYEKGESQKFWLSLLSDVLGVAHASEVITFEDQVHLDHTSFIDGFIPETHVLIEQKSLGKSLTAAIKQSDGTMLSPIQQALRYVDALLHEKGRQAVPRWIVTCNFEEFRVYDMDHPQNEAQVIRLADLEKEYHRLKFLVDTGSENLRREMQISLDAGRLVGRLYDALLKQYKDPTDDHSLKSLNALCVRLVFCLYAEDAGIFGRHLMFHDYIKAHTPQQTRKALVNLFRVLDQKSEARDPYLADDDPLLAAFPYVNGGLFSDESIEIPPITEEIYRLLLRDASEDFDWSEISPTIFGAVFESTLNPETRRSGGMHYTSIENIHKVIDPLFLDDLKAEYARIMADNVIASRHNALDAFQDKLASLTFLDPACGSGNFLTESYLSLRRLENKVIRALLDSRTARTKKEQMKITAGQIALGGSVALNPIRVSISQFYGIEINDFAVTVARTALWIAESQMMKETEDIVHMKLDFLPLKTQANIVEGNALRLDWNEVVDKSQLSYIMGNPPFVGARMMSKAQKDDVLSIFGAKWLNVGNLDYVSCWYKRASDFMQGTDIRAALVSTNSVTQGEAVANLWKPLMADGVHIDFAHRTFRWDSEASIKAHVHCVIVGFSIAPFQGKRVIFDNGQAKEVSHINGYLVDTEDVFIDTAKHPISRVPEIMIGSQPIDDGNYLFEKEEMDSFLMSEPASKKYFHPWYGSREFINQVPRYCLYLGNCPPSELRKMPECLKRVEAVRDFRLQSNRASTKKAADMPSRFGMTSIPESDYIIIPKVSSEHRRYIPMGFMTPDVLCSDLVFLIPDATLYHFGVLESNVHMAWMRTVCGRLKSDYRYSKDIVYNNFPWPTPTDAQQARIEQTAQAILDARALYPDASLADLYDELTMPPELRKAHQQNDRAVMDAYGLPVRTTTESSCVAHLMRLYQELTAK